jgi:hypothetical protein
MLTQLASPWYTLRYSWEDILTENVIWFVKITPESAEFILSTVAVDNYGEIHLTLA